MIDKDLKWYDGIQNRLAKAKAKKGESGIPIDDVAGPESAGVLGVGDGEVAADVDPDACVGGASDSCVGLWGPWSPSPFTAPGSDTRFIASICSLFSPIRLFAWLPSWGVTVRLDAVLQAVLMAPFSRIRKPLTDLISFYLLCFLNADYFNRSFGLLFEGRNRNHKLIRWCLSYTASK